MNLFRAILPAAIALLAGCDMQGLGRAGPEHDCVEYHLDRFRFPDTVEIVSTKIEGDMLHVTVTAKNAFGVPGRHNLKCALSHGRFDRLGTFNLTTEDFLREHREALEACELESWTYRTLVEGITQIDGKKSCRDGVITIRVHDQDDNYLGNTTGIITGYAFTAFIQTTAPQRMRIQYTIDTD